MTPITAESIMNNIKRTLEEDDGGAAGDGAETHFYGVTVGWVAQPVDQLTLGRVQVRLPAIDSTDLLRLARVAVPMAGAGHGHYFIPSVGDEVLVAFEHGELDAPVIIGSLWNMMAPPPLPSQLAEIRAIRTLAGNQIVLSEAPPSIAIQTAPTPVGAVPAPASSAGPHQTVMLGPDGIALDTPIAVTLRVGASVSTVTVTPASIELRVGSSAITISPSGIEITGGSVDIRAVGDVAIDGAFVRLNS